MKEIWKEIENAWSRYEVSNLGRIRIKTRYDSQGRKAGGRVLALNKRDKDGYVIFEPQYKGVKKYIKVHRAVAKAFIKNPENKLYVDHINTVKDDNRVENLRWVTMVENANNPLTIEHNRKAQTGKKMSAESSLKKRAAMPKKAVRQFTVSGEPIGTFIAIKDAARSVGTSCGSITNCCKGRNKTAGGFIWRYA